MATRYAGRCGVAGCGWQFSSPSPALLTELYGNHFKKAHTGSATLLIEPGSLVIPWPPDSQELIRLNLAESPEQSRARAARRLLVASVGSAGAAACMLIVAVFTTTNPASAAGIAVLGGPTFWIGLFAAELLVSAGVVLYSVRVRRSSVSMSFRRFGFVFLIAASAASVLVAGFLWLGLISVADMGTAGDLPASFVNLYFLQMVLAVLSVVGLIGSTQLFRNASKTGPPAATGHLSELSSRSLPPAPDKHLTAKMILAIAIPLILGIAVAAGAARVFLSHGPGTVFQRSDIASVCDQPFAKPGASVQEGSQGCGMTLGGLLFDLDCSAMSASVDGTVAFVDLPTGRGNITELKHADRSCLFQVKQGQGMAISTNASTSDAVVLIDFTPPAASWRVTANLRCTDAHCVGMELFNDGRYDFWQQQSGSRKTLLAGKLGGEGYPVPELQLGQANRLVFSVTGNQVGAMLNGRDMGQARTDVGADSRSVVVLVANDTGSSAITIDVIRIQVYRPSSSSIALAPPKRPNNHWFP